MPPKLKTRRFCPNPGVHCKVVGFWSEFQKRCFLISWNSPFRTPTRRNCFKMRANSLCRTEISKLDRNRRARKYPSNSQRRRARPGGAREQKFSTSASAPRLFSFKKTPFWAGFKAFGPVGVLNGEIRISKSIVFEIPTKFRPPYNAPQAAIWISNFVKKFHFFRLLCRFSEKDQIFISSSSRWIVIWSEFL